jgi:nucleotide-binding universal stress UspA family protein
MPAFQKILFPTDFSDASRVAVPYVKQLADTFKAQIHVLHIMEPVLQPADFAWVTVNYPEMQQKREAALKEGLAKLVHDTALDGPRNVTATGQGSPAGEIARYAKEHQIDLIVMATHGHTGLTHLLLGSVTERVVRQAPCPVLTVKVPPHHKGAA